MLFPNVTPKYSAIRYPNLGEFNSVIQILR